MNELPADDEWYGPAQKSRFRVLRNEGEGKGPLEIEFVDQPGNPGPPTHWHPNADEEFVVLEGRLAVVVDGEEVVLGPGDSRLIPRGARHTFRNADPDTPVRFRSVHTPGLQFERLLASMYDLDLDGKTDDKGTPTILAAMAVMATYPDVTVIAGPPRAAQRAAAVILGAVARLLGHQGNYRAARRS